jgi:hypothetical protein
LGGLEGRQRVMATHFACAWRKRHSIPQNRAAF